MPDKASPPTGAVEPLQVAEEEHFAESAEVDIAVVVAPATFAAGATSAQTHNYKNSGLQQFGLVNTSRNIHPGNRHPYTKKNMDSTNMDTLQQ